MTPRLALENVDVRFGGLAAVRDLSLTIAPGDIRALIGPNGAGNTTALNVLAEFSLLPHRGRRASDLPFGVLKRMELARALAALPRLLLMDEPTSGMSESEADSAIAAVRRIAESRSITLLVIEHNMRV